MIIVGICDAYALLEVGEAEFFWHSRGWNTNFSTMLKYQDQGSLNSLISISRTLSSVK
jgi:hypothetical protein